MYDILKVYPDDIAKADKGMLIFLLRWVETAKSLAWNAGDYALYARANEAETEIDLELAHRDFIKSEAERTQLPLALPYSRLFVEMI